MPITDGINILAGYTIKGHTAIDIKDTLITNFTNRGTISGTDKAINDFWRITGSFENYGTVKGVYAFYDNTKSAATYEILNHSGATIEGDIITVAKRIENSGIISKGKVNLYFADLVIENTLSGKIQVTEIKFDSGGHIALNNSGEMTVTSKLNIDKGLTNSGTIIQGNSDNLTSGTFLTNSGYIQSTGAQIKILAGSNKMYNSGIIKGKEFYIDNADYLIENTRSGKIQATKIKFDSGGHIALNNSGEITVTGEFNIDKDLTNSGTIVQKTSGNLQLGSGSDNSHQVTNSGYIRVFGYNSYNKTTNKASGYMHFEGSKYYDFNAHQVINEGTIVFIGTDGTQHWMNFTEGFNNSGYITLDSRGFQSYKNSVNSGTIEQVNASLNFSHKNDTSSGNDTVTNTGYIKTWSLTTYNKIDNQATGTIIIETGISHANITNAGYIKTGTFTTNNLTNQASGYMLVNNAIDFQGSLTNEGTLEATGTTSLVFSGSAHNTGIIITSASTDITINNNFTNDGTINQENLTKDFNIGDGSSNNYTLTNNSYIRTGSLTIYNKLDNHATLVVGKPSSNEMHLKDSATVNNYGYMDVKKGLTSDINTNFNNSGTALVVFTNVGADFKGLVNNSATIKTVNTSLTTYTRKFTTSGVLNVGATVTIGSGGLDNSGIFNTIAVGSSSSGLLSNLTKGIFKCTDPISANNLQIDNQAIIVLPSFNSIGDYHGKSASELILNLPTGATVPTNTLVTVTNNATFDAGAKIILAASSSIQYLNNPIIINIVKAGNVTVDGVHEELLRGRVYDSTGKKLIKAASTIVSNSILIDIISPIVTKQVISAGLQMADTSTLQIRQSLSKVTNS